MNIRISVRAIALLNGKLLAVRHKNSPDDTLGYHWWALPGGKLEPGEAVEDALKREITEETGITPIIGKLLYVHQFDHNTEESLEFFFHITNSADFANINLSSTTHGYKELAEIAFIDPKAVEIYPLFLFSENLVAQTRTTQVKFISYLK